MSFLAFAFELYFALIFSVSSLGKLDDPAHFSVVLRQQRILPSWSIQVVSEFLPWVEIAVAILLISGMAPLASAVAAAMLFVIFLTVKIILLVTKDSVDCGCYGDSQLDRVDTASLVVSTLFVLFAGIHLWLIRQTVSVDWQWRVFAVVLFLAAGAFFFKRIFARRSTLQLTPFLQIDSVGGLDIGEIAPTFIATDQYNNVVHFDDFGKKQRLLAFVKPGCLICPKALEALEYLIQNEQDIIGLVVGSSNHEKNRIYITEHTVKLPFLTPDSDSVKKLYKVRASPLVFVVDEAGVIRAKGIVNRVEHLQQLLATAAK